MDSFNWAGFSFPRCIITARDSREQLRNEYSDIEG